MKKRRKQRLLYWCNGKSNPTPGCPARDRMYYVWKVYLMSDEQLYKETEQKIWLSAYAGNNPRSDFHWHVDALYSECDRRNRLDIYKDAYSKVERQVG